MKQQRKVPEEEFRKVRLGHLTTLGVWSKVVGKPDVRVFDL